MTHYFFLKPLKLLVQLVLPDKPVVFVGDQVRMITPLDEPPADIFLVMVIHPPFIFLRCVSKLGLQPVYVYALNDIVKLIKEERMDVKHAK